MRLLFPKRARTKAILPFAGIRRFTRIESTGTVTLTSTGDPRQDVITKETRSYEIMKAPGYGPLALPLLTI